MAEDIKINRFLKFSPIVVITGCSLISIIFTIFLGVNAYIPVLLIYWSILLIFIILKGDFRTSIKKWLQPAKGNKLWSIIPFLFTFMSLPMLIMNWALLADPYILISLIIFSVVNPWFEEFYWRGLILDLTEKWSLWVRLLYSAVLFTINHPLMVGIFSIANRMVVFLFTTVILGVIYGLIYIKTASLRWLILAHGLLNFLGISTAIFLNYYIPEGPRLW